MADTTVDSAVSVETSAKKLADNVIDLNGLAPDMQGGCRVFVLYNGRSRVLAAPRACGLLLTLIHIRKHITARLGNRSHERAERESAIWWSDWSVVGTPKTAKDSARRHA
jgi:hypothetical protein